MPGTTNIVADAMSRWAYPASTAREDVCAHGSADSAQEVRLMEEEQQTWKQAPSKQVEIKEQESYKLVTHVRDETLASMGVAKGDIKVDLFASSENTHEAFFITKSMDAFSYDWGKLCQQPSDVLWANPPFSMMEQVVSKLALEPCKIAICVPVREQKLWWKSLHDLCISYICLPTERGIYLEGWKRKRRLLQPPTWQSAIFLLDSRVRTCAVTP